MPVVTENWRRVRGDIRTRRRPVGSSGDPTGVPPGLGRFGRSGEGRTGRDGSPNPPDHDLGLDVGGVVALELGPGIGGSPGGTEAT